MQGPYKYGSHSDRIGRLTDTLSRRMLRFRPVSKWPIPHTPIDRFHQKRPGFLGKAGKASELDPKGVANEEGLTRQSRVSNITVTH